MNSVHFGQVGSAFSMASKPSFVLGSGWISLLGILNLRSTPSLPWQVAQLNFLNLFASKAWKIGFIVGSTASFMYAFFCLKVMSFQATWGGPTALPCATRTP